VEAREKLEAHLGPDLDVPLADHFIGVGKDIGFFANLGDDCFQDPFGVVWDRSIDKDIGNVRGQVLPEPTLRGYEFPDPRSPLFFSDIPGVLARYGDSPRAAQHDRRLQHRDDPRVGQLRPRCRQPRR
jgi:uroporphyrinogen decarboxylase